MRREDEWCEGAAICPQKVWVQESGSGNEMSPQKANNRSADPTSNVFVEIPIPSDPHSPRKWKFVCDAASLIVFYDEHDSETITGIELCLAKVPKGKSPEDIFISSDDYDKKFVITPAVRTTGGMVRGRAVGYVDVDKSEVLDKARICTANLDSEIRDFLPTRFKKYLR
jgi:hypothetical protein